MKKDAKNTEGTPRLMGRLEQEILDILWDAGPSSGKEIFEGIKKGRAIAITTVLTVIERLTRKGLVVKSRGAGVYIFKAAYSKEEFARKVSDDVLRGIFEISASGACASFVDMLARTDRAELERLSDIIEKKKTELKSGGHK